MMTTQHFACKTAGDPVDDLHQCQLAIRAASWWACAGLEERWPLDTDQAAQLLSQGGEYDVDSAGLQDLVARRLLGSPARDESGELEWNAADVLSAFRVLEERGQWRPAPSWHDPKKHPCQVVLEQARAAGEVHLIVNGPNPRLDLRHLLAFLVASDVHEGRAKIVALLRAVLEVEHGVIV